MPSLNHDHELGRAKAQGFRRILGVESADVEYLVDASSSGVLTAAVTGVRDNAPFGVLCEVGVLVGGLREHRGRSEVVTTSWELRQPDDAPRLVTAYVDG